VNNKRRKEVASSLALLIISLVISFSLAELLVRSLAPQPFHPGRRLFLNNALFDVTGDGAVRYLPSEGMRMVAVYDGDIEFDVTFGTNNLGFIDNENYPLASVPPDEAYVLVGDSFVAGVHGGEPWVPDLRAMANKPDNSRAIYNLGVEGTGFWHFSKLLEDIQEELSFDVVVIVALSDDFRRPYWTPIVEGSSVHMCPGRESREECVGREPFATLFDESMNQSDLLDLAQQSSGATLLLNDPGRYLEVHAKRSLLLVMLVRGIRSALGVRNTMSFDGFRDLVSRQTGRSVYLLHAPQSHEVSNGRYDIDPSGEASELGVAYIPLLETCDWDDEMFYDRDSHPNERGYHNLGLCVGKALGWL